jgi:hypothetical protein
MQRHRREPSMCCEGKDVEDKFVATVSAKAEVNLRLSEYTPRSELKVEAHQIEQPRFLPRLDDLIESQLQANSTRGTLCLAAS